ncbi:D-alanyl-D-alanine carboxypeptidase family protein [bacterium]|nr:D-alanyl-D-alanine carboxypeptidase family protein [bacterium]
MSVTLEIIDVGGTDTRTSPKKFDMTLLYQKIKPLAVPTKSFFLYNKVMTSERGAISTSSLYSGIALTLSITLSSYAVWQQLHLQNTVNSLALQTQSLSNDIVTLTTAVNKVNAQTDGLSQVVTNAQQHIDAVNSRIGGIEQTVGTVTSTVGTLQKLSQTDPELLSQYSKVYFLSENYTPKHLTDIPSEYVSNTGVSQKFIVEAWPLLKAMIDTAQSEGVPIKIKSSYRSFKEQKQLKNAYTITYGSGANSFSADQGYSEHQLGTTLDFVSPQNGSVLAGFEKTPAYDWLSKNAYRFGFILSYPRENKSYIFEPWHWRFVGIRLATDLYLKNERFYNMTQREIDPYLSVIFDSQ